MNRIDEMNSELLRECNEKCLKSYNLIFKREFEYEDLHLLGAFETTDSENQDKLEELREISRELYEHSILEGETEQDKIEKNRRMKDIRQQLDKLLSDIV